MNLAGVVVTEVSCLQLNFETPCMPLFHHYFGKFTLQAFALSLEATYVAHLKPFLLWFFIHPIHFSYQTRLAAGPIFSGRTGSLVRFFVLYSNKRTPLQRVGHNYHNCN